MWENRLASHPSVRPWMKAREATDLAKHLRNIIQTVVFFRLWQTFPSKVVRRYILNFSLDENCCNAMVGDFGWLKKKRRDREFVELPVCCVLCVLVKCLLLVSRVLLHIYCVRCELVTCLLFVPCEFVVFRCGGSILITCVFSHILHNVFAGNRVTWRSHRQNWSESFGLVIVFFFMNYGERLYIN